MGITVGALQMTSTDHVEDNLKMVSRYMQEATDAGAKLVVLPELFACMRGLNNTPQNICEAPETGPIQAFICALAKQHHIWIVAGTIALTSPSGTDKYRAACLVISAQGKIVARYDKMHLFDVHLSEHETYQESSEIEPGSVPVVVDTPVGRLGLAVCYDLRFPELFRHLTQQGAEVIAIPAAFTHTTGQAHWSVLLRARAIENSCYIIAANQYGRHPSSRHTYGHSMIIDPWGSICGQREIDSGWVFSHIEAERIHNIRTNTPFLSHQIFTVENPNNTA